MNIKIIRNGMLDENCYIIKNNDTCLVVDPGDDYSKINKEIGDSKLLGVLITHSHFDHIGALRNFLTKKSIKIFKNSNVEDNKDYSIGDFKFRVYKTPGHSSDSISFHFIEDKCMFVGDFIFKESIGRCDLPTGSLQEMNNSIEKLLKLDDDITLYTGHYDITTLGYERTNNPYLN